MNKIKLSNSGVEISEMGLGTWAMGGGGWRYSWGPQDDKDSLRTIQKAHELGVNWVDTAPIYGLGRAENIVAGAIKKLNLKLLISTKCGLAWDEKRRIKFSLKKAAVKKDIEDSLKRLKAETIDIYMLHWPIPETDIEEGWSALLDARKDGKVRAAGAANFTLEQIDRISAIEKPDFIQARFNLFAEDYNLFYSLKTKHIETMGYNILNKGIFSGKFSESSLKALPADDHRRKDDEFTGNRFIANRAFALELKALAGQFSRKAAELLIGFIARHAIMSVMVIGARNEEQLEENLLAFARPLTSEEYETVLALVCKYKNIKF